MQHASASHMRQEFERRSQGKEEFRTAAHVPKSAGRQYTTAAMVCMEHKIIGRMQNGNFALENRPGLSVAEFRVELLSRHSQVERCPAESRRTNPCQPGEDRRAGRRGWSGEDHDACRDPQGSRGEWLTTTFHPVWSCNSHTTPNSIHDQGARQYGTGNSEVVH